MELFKDLSIVLIRVVTIFPLMLFVTLFMGRRTVSEMPVFDFLIVIALGSVVGADIAEPSVAHIPTVFAILLIGLLQKLFSISSIRYRWFGKLISFEPVIVIYQGKLVHKNLKKLQYSVDNVLQMLREQQVFDLNTVHLCILEPSGKISLLEQASDSETKTVISYPVIKEGIIVESLLPQLGVTEEWIEQQLAKQHVQLNGVFLATIDDQHNFRITTFCEEEHERLPPIHH